MKQHVPIWVINAAELSDHRWPFCILRHGLLAPWLAWPAAWARAHVEAANDAHAS